MRKKHVAVFGLLIALAFILSYIESLIPLPLPIPGIKLGLANLVVLTALMVQGGKEAWALSFIRILLVSFTFGSPSTFLFSFAGGMLSCLCMWLARRSRLFSISGISMVGGITHNVGQILVAMWVVQTVKLVYYLPFLLIAGIVTGVLIGVLGSLIVGNIRKYLAVQVL